MIRRAGLVLLLALGVGVFLDVATEIAISPPSGVDGAQLVDRWLQAMASTDTDRGWRYLTAEAQAEAYGGDESAYLAEVMAVDWGTVRWGQTDGRTTEYGFVFAYTPLLSDPRTLPRFMHERALVAASCTDRAATQIFANVSTAWFQSPRLTRVNNGTGSAGVCEDFFYKETGPMRPPADLVGLAWATGGNGSVRVEVIDETGLVMEVNGGRDQPPVTGEVSVSDALGQVAVAWMAADCSDPVQIVVRGNADAIELELNVVERPGDECAARSRIYEVMLRFSGNVSSDEVVATRPMSTSSLPGLPSDFQGCAGVGLDAFLAGSPTDPRLTWLVDIGGRRLEILWPRRFTARFDPELAVLDATGRVVHRAGDRIEGACVVGDPDGPLLIPPPL